jgi:hypothetical protein
MKAKSNITYYFDKEKFGQLQLNPFTSISAKEGRKLNPERIRHSPTLPLLCPYVPRLPIVLFSMISKVRKQKKGSDIRAPLFSQRALHVHPPPFFVGC